MPAGKQCIAHPHAADERSNPGSRATPQVADGAALGRQDTLASRGNDHHATYEKDTNEGSFHQE
jgi:hypothetical protein